MGHFIERVGRLGVSDGGVAATLTRTKSRTAGELGERLAASAASPASGLSTASQRQPMALLALVTGRRAGRRLVVGLRRGTCTVLRQARSAAPAMPRRLGRDRAPLGWGWWRDVATCNWKSYGASRTTSCILHSPLRAAAPPTGTGPPSSRHCPAGTGHGRLCHDNGVNKPRVHVFHSRKRRLRRHAFCCQGFLFFCIYFYTNQKR